MNELLRLLAYARRYWFYLTCSLLLMALVGLMALVLLSVLDYLWTLPEFVRHWYCWVPPTKHRWSLQCQQESQAAWFLRWLPPSGVLTAHTSAST